MENVAVRAAGKVMSTGSRYRLSGAVVVVVEAGGAVVEVDVLDEEVVVLGDDVLDVLEVEVVCAPEGWPQSGVRSTGRSAAA